VNTKEPFYCIVNDKEVSTQANLNMVVLDFLRRDRHLTGTKEGCREGDCGACTILIGELHNDEMQYKSVNSCLMPLGDAMGKHLITIEGINQPAELNLIQQAFVDESATQCGFCTPGFLMSLTGYCMNSEHYSFENAVGSMDGNICRCTGHPPIKKAAAKIVRQLEARSSSNGFSHQQHLIEQKILPTYVASIPHRLKKMEESLKDLKIEIEEHVHIVSGGTDLYVQRAFTMVNEKTKRLAGEKKPSIIREVNGDIHVSGTTTVEEFQRSETMRAFISGIETFSALFGSTPIRNRATLAGNIVNASPIGDMTALLLALNASLILARNESTRNVSLRKFYKGYKQTDKASDEIIETIVLPKPSRPRVVNFEKVSRRRYLDIASVNSAMTVSAEGHFIVEANLTAGGVSATPLFLFATSEFLRNKEISDNVLVEAESTIQQEIKPISDARGSADYKRLLLRQLFFAHMFTFFPEVSLPVELTE
jgi:xanthine dehydrogenase small subunit